MGLLIIPLVLLAVAIAAAFVIFLVIPFVVVIYRKSSTQSGQEELKLIFLPFAMLAGALFTSLAAWRLWNAGFQGWLIYCCPVFSTTVWIGLIVFLVGHRRYKDIPRSVYGFALEYRLAFYQVRGWLRGAG
jgi:amino acid transporter